MKFSRTSIGITLVAGLSLVAAACTPQDPSQREVTLYFYSSSDWQNAVMENPAAVTRMVEGADVEAMDATLQLLFAGPTSEEWESGALSSADLTNLGSFYLGVQREGNVAIVNFKKEALEILNSAAARQHMAKEPIRRTLKQFPGIEEIQYAIDSEIFDEWDA